MEVFWNIFRQICEIPRCSGHALEMETFIRNWAKTNGYVPKSDKAGNIICYHNEATLTLQSHYDMLCLDEVPNLELIEKMGKLCATESTLGADSGVGVAMMLLAMQDKKPVDFLFTADKEIGLVGVRALELTVKTKHVLNLNAQESETVYTACAGGLDLIGTLELNRVRIEGAKYYECSIDNLPGGHSSLDIDKNIPNANLEIVKLLQKSDIKLTGISGGQLRNTISKSAKALFIMEEGAHVPSQFKEAENQENVHYYADTESILLGLVNMPHGVKKDNNIYNIPHNSVNFAQMKIEDHKLIVELSLRAMDGVGMIQLEEQTRSYLDNFRFKIKEENVYPAWIVEKSEFAQRLSSAVEEVEGFVEFKALHAGLECAVLKRKAPKLEYASIGANITGSNTPRESVDMGSVARFKEIVYKFIDSEAAFVIEDAEAQKNKPYQGTREKGTKNKKNRR
ncbi:MAG TPA: M20/M25/M40 family metallo-hydrolase [Sulfurimonas sp.]|nr:M20/M25/M40 family metallo-hydrolase [Sulfurimonas sp.]